MPIFACTTNTVACCVSKQINGVSVLDAKYVKRVNFLGQGRTINAGRCLNSLEKFSKGTLLLCWKQFIFLTTALVRCTDCTGMVLPTPTCSPFQTLSAHFVDSRVMVEQVLNVHETKKNSCWVLIQHVYWFSQKFKQIRLYNSGFYLRLKWQFRYMKFTEV